MAAKRRKRHSAARRNQNRAGGMSRAEAQRRRERPRRNALHSLLCASASLREKIFAGRRDSDGLRYKTTRNFCAFCAFSRPSLCVQSCSFLCLILSPLPETKFTDLAFDEARPCAGRNPGQWKPTTWMWGRQSPARRAKVVPPGFLCISLTAGRGLPALPTITDATLYL